MEKLKEQYQKEVIPALMKKFEYKSLMEVPKLEKIVINIGLGDVKDNPKSLDNAISDLTIITGQKPVITKAKKSIAAFKLREGVNVGCKVTLRAGKMYDFADKLFNLALPRVRDFRGVSKNSFDGKGNYSLGIKEQLIFPEIEYDKIDRPQKYSTREYNRCKLCGRPHAYIRKYGICRICFRELAHKGEIPGVKKASW